MIPTEPLPLHHSWPLADAACRLDLGRVHDEGTIAPSEGASPHAFGEAGRWMCNLADNTLRWSPEVFGLFGIRPDRAPSRDVAVSCYSETSRAAMERLRNHAIRHRRGFTLDVAITPIDGARRWLRLTAAPVIEAGRVIRLHGCKADVSHLYTRR